MGFLRKLFGKSPAPPPAPDYAALATQQGVANKETAVFNANSNRVNQYTPDGSLTWSRTPVGDGTAATDDGSGWTQTIALSPEQQVLYDAEARLSQKSIGAAESGIDRATAALAAPVTSENVPALNYGPGSGNVGQVERFGMDTMLSPLMVQGQQPVASQATASQANASGNISSLIDRSGVRTLPGSIDDTSRRRVEEALMSRLNPSLQLDEDRLRTRLLNSGIEVGTNAYNREMTLSGQRMTDARMQAILAGGQEESRQVGLTQGLQAQEFGQAQTQAQLRQAADTQMLAQQTALAQHNASLATQTSLANAAAQTQASGQAASLDAQRRQALIDTALRTTQSQAGLVQQDFNMGLAGAQMNNQTRAQEMQEQAALRLQPLNEVNAMRSGGQVDTPTFGTYYTNNAQAAPVFDAGLAQGKYDMDMYQQRVAGKNALWGGLAQLGSAAIAASDIRLKTNILRIGTHPSGVGRYSWDWKDGSGGDSGVLAQELAQVCPEAVTTMPNGYLGVRYGMIGGK